MFKLFPELELILNHVVTQIATAQAKNPRRIPIEDSARKVVERTAAPQQRDVDAIHAVESLMCNVNFSTETAVISYPTWFT